MQNFKFYLEKEKIEYLENQPLAEYTTFNIGGPAKFVVKPDTITELQNILKYLRTNFIDYFILGKGSNLLVSDDGYNGVIILTSGLDEIEFIAHDKIKAYCGVPLIKLCNAALTKSLSGLEFAYGIPGSVGGAVYMNAGAYGGEFKDVILSCDYIDQNGGIITLPIDKMCMEYRKSFFTGKNCMIVSALLKLNQGNKDEIKALMDLRMDSRKAKQPLNYPSGGSTFKRPANGYAAALIEECGLKGYSIGGAQVSTKHSGFIINKGNATCKDVLDLVSHIKNTVYQKKNILLECEIKTLGL